MKLFTDFLLEKANLDKDRLSINKVLKPKELTYNKNKWEGLLNDDRTFIVSRENGPLEATVFKDKKEQESIFISK